jgi:hypothetical protein
MMISLKFWSGAWKPWLVESGQCIDMIKLTGYSQITTGTRRLGNLWALEGFFVNFEVTGQCLQVCSDWGIGPKMKTVVGSAHAIRSSFEIST